MKLAEAAARLEHSLGSPEREDGAFSLASSLAHDEREAFPQAACDALLAGGYFDHFIPARHGGKLEDLGALLMMGRVVARRDLTVAIATGQTLLGALPVWLDGSESQRARVAELVRRGDPGCLALTEQEHGSDIAATDVTFARASDGALRLSGTKWCINNATRSKFMTVLARSESDGGHALVLVDKERLADRRPIASLPRLRTHGVRGADISGARFDAAAIGAPADVLVGREGNGLHLVFRTLQLSRTACAAFSLGAGDTALRLAYGFASKRRLYGSTAYAIPIVRHALANALADLLAAEVLALVVCRAASLVPEQMSVHSAVVKALVPALVGDVIQEAGVVLGARGYLREGPHASFQKLARDHAVVGLFDGSTAVNLSVLANQLPRLASARAGGAPAANGALFALDGELPDALFANRLRTTARGADSLAGAIPELAMAADGTPAAPLARVLEAELRAFDRSLVERADAAPGDDAKTFAFARRYCLLAAGAATLGVLASRSRDDVLVAVLARIVARLTMQDDADSARQAALARALESACEQRQLFSIVPFDLAG